MAKRSRRDPFEIKLSAEREDELISFLKREIGYAQMSRMTILGDDGALDDGHMKYRGGDPNLVVDHPWPGASNLGSWLVTESVDAMRARVMATIFTDPIWVVEGYGKAAERAPVVEEFMQWKADQGKLQQFMGRGVHNALIEGTGVIEVSDRVVMIKSRQQIRAKLQTEEGSSSVPLDTAGHPTFVRTATGKFVEVESPDEPHAVVVADVVTRASAGPSYRVIGLKDFYILPGHAAERADIWGYAKRVFRRLAELKRLEADGIYKNIDALGGVTGERESSTGGISTVPGMAVMGQDVAPQHDEVTAEKEIWELTLLMDLDDDGYDEWYIVTFSFLHGTILRIQYENYDTPSYILLVPFPRTDSVYGFSFAKDKLGSLYDEHAAYRNMYVDRMALKTAAPFLQVEGSPWNPAERPFGPMEVIPVRDINELKQLEIADVPNSVVLAMKEVVAAKERISGMNDTTTGQVADSNNTLGAVKLATQQSWIRIDEVIKNFQQSFEDLFDILLIIWRNKLRDAPEKWPGDMIVSMSQRAIDLSDEITWEVLEGQFRGKPRGSVEASDFSQMRSDMVQMITALTQLGQTVPALKLQLNNPQAIRSILTQIARVYRWPDRNNLIGTFTGAPPQMPPKEPEAPKISLSIKADAATDPLARQILSEAANKNGVGPADDQAAPVGVAGVANVAPVPQQ